jgi:hypothetical protein
MTELHCTTCNELMSGPGSLEEVAARHDQAVHRVLHSTTSTPSAPSPPPPDPTGWLAWAERTTDRHPWLVLAMSLLGITISMTVQTVANNWKEDFAANADVVNAHVIGTDSYLGDLHTITVRYRRDGREIETTHNVVSAGSYEIGDSVEVLVDRNDPAVAHLEKPGDFLPLLVSGPYVLPAVVGGFGLAWLLFWSVRRRIRSRPSNDLDTAQPHQRPRTNNRFAVASVVLGALWIFWIGSVLAVALGHRARRQIGRTGGTEGGRGMATAGIVLGYIGLAWFGWLFVTA